MKIAICPGSFDPVTLGHIDIIERAAELFDKVIVLVMTNSEKNALFSLGERVDLLKKCVKKQNVEIDTYNGLLVSYAKKVGAVAIVKAYEPCLISNMNFSRLLQIKASCRRLKRSFSPQRV